MVSRAALKSIVPVLASMPTPPCSASKLVPTSSTLFWAVMSMLPVPALKVPAFWLVVLETSLLLLPSPSPEIVPSPLTPTVTDTLVLLVSL